jgi:hypothetical protein
MGRWFTIGLFLFLQTVNLSADTKNNQTLLSLRRNEGQIVGNERSYTTFEVCYFSSRYQNIWPFIDLRYHCCEKFVPYAANVGLGLRTSPKNTEIIFGFNAYYDVEKRHRHCFNQLGLGFEILNYRLFNFRWNGYLPLGKKKNLTSSSLFDGYSDGYFILREDFLKSLKGMNFEIEAQLTKIFRTQIFLTIAAYYYKNHNRCRGDIYGSEYRLTAKPCNYFTINLSLTNDNLFKTNVQGQFVLTIPFNSYGENERAIFQPVKRHELIVVDKQRWWTKNF